MPQRSSEQKVAAATAASLTILASAITVTFLQLQQQQRAQRSRSVQKYYRNGYRLPLSIVPGLKFSLEGYNETWCKEFLR